MNNSPLLPDSESALPVAAVDRQPASPPRAGNPSSGRFTGTLSLFQMDHMDRGEEAGPSSLQARPQASYVRFRLCRGYIDDLNRVLPIRVRIQLEGEIGKGGRRGRVEGGAMRFRWEFAEA